MASWAFNESLMQAGYYATLPLTNDALLVIPIESTGLEADATLRDYDNLSALLAGATNEQTTLGRKTVTSVTITIDDTNERKDLDIADQIWAGAAGNPVGALLFCYDPDTTVADDATVKLLSKHDFVFVPSGSQMTAQVANFLRGQS